MSLQTLREKIETCRKYAPQCACRAQTTDNKTAREGYLRIEKSWINLSHSYEFAAQVLKVTISPNLEDRRRPLE